MATRTQKVDFIYKNFTFKGGMTKKQITNKSDKVIDDFISKYQKEFDEWLNKPKDIKFLVDGVQDGKDLSWDAQYPDEESCRKAFETEGIKVIMIAPAKGHHRCMYCGSIAKGSQKDILCGECRDVFGHYSYYEL